MTQAQYSHAALCAQEAVLLVSQRYGVFVDAAMKNSPWVPGEANRLNDYVRDLKAALHNLEHFLDHAGTGASFTLPVKKGN